MKKTEDFDQIFGSLQDLPTLPTVVSKISTMVMNPRTSASDIQQVIQQDQSLTATILKLANSAYFGLLKKVYNVTQAVVVLGFNTVKNIAITATVFKMFYGSKKKEIEGFDRFQLWRHSIGTAVCCKTISKNIKIADPENCFIYGLLHDLGKVVVDEYLHNDFESVLKIVEDKNILIREAEREVLGFDHTKIGKWLVSTWNFPKNIEEAIEFHHRPTYAPIYKAEASIVHLGDIIARVMRIGSGGDLRIPVYNLDVTNILQIKKEMIKEILIDYEEELEKAKTFLEM